MGQNTPFTAYRTEGKEEMKPIEVIYKKPREGKTTELIKRCAENGGYIVCATSMRARHAYEMAKELGYKIPYPLTFDELLEKRYYPQGVKKIYIDDAIELIQKIVKGLDVESVAIDDLSDAIERMKQEESKCQSEK